MKKQKKINVIFDQNFEKSPLEILNSLETMCKKMEKIKTPAAFASANTMYGFSKYTFINKYYLH